MTLPLPSRQPSSPRRPGQSEDNSNPHDYDREDGPRDYTFAPLTVGLHTNDNKNNSDDADYLNELEAEYLRLKQELEAVQQESVKQEEIGMALEQECVDLQEQIAESQRKEKEQRKLVKKLHAENEEIQRMTDKKVEERDALKIETEQAVAERDNLQKKLEALTNNKGINSILMKLEALNLANERDQTKAERRRSTKAAEHDPEMSQQTPNTESTTPPKNTPKSTPKNTPRQSFVDTLFKKKQQAPKEFNVNEFLWSNSSSQENKNGDNSVKEKEEKQEEEQKDCDDNTMDDSHWSFQKNLEKKGADENMDDYMATTRASFSSKDSGNHEPCRRASLSSVDSAGFRAHRRNSLSSRDLLGSKATRRASFSASARDLGVNKATRRASFSASARDLGVNKAARQTSLPGSFRGAEGGSDQPRQVSEADAIAKASQDLQPTAMDKPRRRASLSTAGPGLGVTPSTRQARRASISYSNEVRNINHAMKNLKKENNVGASGAGVSRRRVERRRSIV